MLRFGRWFLLIVIGCLWVSFAYAANSSGQPAGQAAPSNTQEAPSIEIPEATFNFGEVIEGGEVLHDFTVKNTGKGVLQIEQVRPG